MLTFAFSFAFDSNSSLAGSGVSAGMSCSLSVAPPARAKEPTVVSDCPASVPAVRLIRPRYLPGAGLMRG